MHTFLLSVSATTDFYEKWSNILSNKHIVWDICRGLGWLIVKLFATICDACEKLLEYANISLSFILSPEIVQFIGKWKYVIYGILIIAILFFGINMIINRKQERAKLLQNIVIAVLVLMCSTTAVIQLTTNTQSFSLELLDTSNSTSAEKVIKDSITDLYYLDANDFSDYSAQQKNVIPASSITNINPTEDIKASDDVENPDIFKYKHNNDGKTGKSQLEEIDDGGIVAFNNNTYYRYHIDFITIFMTLFATSIVMIFTSFKVVKIVFDIIVHQILATLMAAGDWASGQKLKEVVKSLFALFFLVFMCSVMMKLYFMFSAWTSGNIKSGAARGFILIFAAFAVIDGPNIVEKIFGIDAGLASTFRSVSTLFFAASGAARVAKGAGHTVGNAIRGTAHAGGTVGGFIGSVFGNRNANAAGNPTDGGINGHAKENSPDIANAANQNRSGEKSGGVNSSPNSNGHQSNAKNNNGKTGSENNISNADNISASDKNNASDISNIASSEQNNPISNPGSDGQSISNKASQKQQNNGYDYWENKGRNPRSVTGAAIRGKNAGQYWGNKVSSASANRRERQEAKRNAKGDKK